MKKAVFKIPAVLLIVALLLGACPIFALAEEVLENSFMESMTDVELPMSGGEQSGTTGSTSIVIEPIGNDPLIQSVTDVVPPTDDVVQSVTTEPVVADHTAMVHEGGISVRANDSTAASAINGGDLTVNGSVSAGGEGSIAVYAEGENSGITVNGGVSTDGGWNTSVKAENGGSVAVNGSVSTGSSSTAVYAAGENSNVTVNGSVSANGSSDFAVGAYAGGSIAVNGDITGKSDNSWGIYTENGNVVVNNGAIHMKGDVSSAVEAYGESRILLNNTDVNVGGGQSWGLVAGSNASVIILNGDLNMIGEEETGSSIALNAWVNPEHIVAGDDRNAVIVVDGAINLKGEDAVLYENYYGNEPSPYVDVYVTTINMAEGASLSVNDDPVQNGLILEAINYIIHADEGVTVRRKTEEGLADVDYNGELDIYSAKYGDELIVTLASGYKWKDKNVQLKDNGDGTYTLTVTENGNLIFEATIEKKKAKAEQKSLAQQIRGGKFGDVLTDANGEAVEFTAEKKGGELTLTAADETAVQLNVTAKLAKALTGSNVKTLTVKLQRNAYSFDTAELKTLTAEGGRVVIDIDDEAESVKGALIADDTETDVTDRLSVEIAPVAEAAL